MTTKEPPKQPRNKKGNKQKSQSNKNQKSNKTKLQLSENNKKLISELLSQKETIAIISHTEPLTTIKEVIKAMRKDPEDKHLQNQVSEVLKLSGWEKLGKKTYQGKQQRVWGKPYLTPTLNQETKNGGGIIAEVTDIQSISPTILPTDNLSQKPGQDTSDKSSHSQDSITIPPPEIKSTSSTESVIEEEIGHGYLPYGEQDVEQVQETLLTDLRGNIIIYTLKTYLLSHPLGGTSITYTQ